MMVPWPCWRISRHRLLHHEERRLHVDAEEPVEGGRRRVVDAAALGVAGGVHENIEAAKGAFHRRHGARRKAEIHQVALDGLDPARPRRAAALSRSLAPLRSSSITPSKPAIEKALCRGKAHALRAARDQRHLALCACSLHWYFPFRSDAQFPLSASAFSLASPFS